MSHSSAFERNMFISGRNLETVAAWHGLSREELSRRIHQVGPEGLLIDTGSGRSPIFAELISEINERDRPYLVAIDTDPACVAAVKELLPPNAGKVSVEEVSALNLSKRFGEESASLIISSFLFPYWNTNQEEGRQFIDELHRTLAPDGRALIAPLFLQPGPSAIHDAKKMEPEDSQKFITHLRLVEREFVEELYRRQKTGEIDLTFRYSLDELDQMPIFNRPELTEVSQDRYPHWYDHYAVGLAVEITKLQPKE